MHKWVKEIMECVQSKVKAKGLDNINLEELTEFELWTRVASNIAKFDYHHKIVEEMEKPENQYGKNYDENGRFYTQPRNDRGEFMRRSYEYDPSHNRDMDVNMGRMYYSDMGVTTDFIKGESKYDRARRGYEEAKDMNPGVDNVKSVDKIFDAFESDLKELKPKMTTNEKSAGRNRLTMMANMMM